jgi:SAM-dependent methyltransferase
VTSRSPRYMREPAYVRRQYATESGLAARSSLYEETTGPFAGDVALEALVETAPRRVLEVGCGQGWFASRVAEHGIDVVAIDLSERMVELSRERGVDARVADVQALPFADAEFDCVAANWMLYHVPDLDLGLREIARVLVREGRLVAATNGHDHLYELWSLVRAGEERLGRDLAFSAENGADALRRHFAHVEMRDARGTVTIRDRDAIVRYIGSMEAWNHLADRVPDTIALPVVARRANVVFVADKAS